MDNDGMSNEEIDIMHISDYILEKNSQKVSEERKFL